MLKRLSDPKNTTLRTPSKDAVALLRKVLDAKPSPRIAEIGVGVGATSYALAKMLKGAGTLELFDYENTLAELRAELDEEGFRNVTYRSNGRKTFDSYNWTLVNILREHRAHRGANGYDLVYLDGAHAFQHDAPAAMIVKELLTPGGYILFDDFMWTFASSPTANPNINKFTKDHYSQEQIDVPHVELVCELFFDHDPNFMKVDLGYSEKELRRAYQKLR